MAPRSAVLGIENGGFYYGTTKVFSGISFTLDSARTGLVGENGAGKSTMLKCLLGELELNEGQIVKSRGFRMGYLAQEIPQTLLQKTVREIMEGILARIDSHDEWKIDVLLEELGISYEKSTQPFSTFSGGWQRIILITAECALGEPDLLILDEPTNHLDLSHLARLEDWLLNHTDVPMLIVSHDRVFLDRITNRTIFLRSDGAHKFATSFIAAREALLQRDAADAAKRALEDKEISRLKEMANRYKAWGVLNSDFHKKMKNTERRIERLETSRANTYVKNDRSLAMHDGDLNARTALRIEDFTVTTPPDVHGQVRELYYIERLAIKPGERVALLGGNGAGKSCLLGALANAYNPNQTHYETGKAIRYSPAVNMVYFDQRMKVLPLDMTLLDYIANGDMSNHSRDIALLAKSGFNFTRAKSKISELSYGERSRLLFLRMKLLQPNFYLLDEPTNHIDIEGQEDLESQMTKAEVSCLFVSHDRYFTRSAATRFVEIRPGRPGSKQIAKLVDVDSPDEFFARQSDEAA